MFGKKNKNADTQTDDLENKVVEPVEKKKKSRFLRPVLTIIVVCFCIYAVGDIISQQAQIVQLQKETNQISQKITEAKQQNDEYSRLLSSDEAEYIERIAIEKFGYAYPNERRFYIVNSGK